MELGEPPTKIRRLSQCIICLKKLTGQVVKNPSQTGLQSLLQACELRGDDIAQRILPIKDQILAGEYPLSFHKTCRATYTSKSNLKYAGNTKNSFSPCPSSDDTPSRLTRGLSSSSQFNIRTQCFICGSSTKRTEKLTQVVTGTGKATRDKVLKAASARNDDLVCQRMVAHPDLFAYDAKYHRSCYSHYISERNINAAKRRDSVTSNLTDLAFEELVEYITNTVLSSRKIVTSLSSLRIQYEEYLQESEKPDIVYSWGLKKRLVNHFGDKLVFLDRNGKSDIVCSSDVTVGTALSKATELQDQLHTEVELQSFLESSPEHDDEKTCLHKAAGILRQSMRDIDVSREHYIPSTDMSRKKCSEFVPKMLFEFISWLIDDSSYTNVSSGSPDSSMNRSISTVAICHDIIGQCRKIVTPVTLGLGVYIQHEFGSKKLIEELHSMGHCVSYDEVRRFLTSAAIDQQSQDVYVPKGLRTSNDNDFSIVDAAIDNFDQNEETLDGKSTTHALAAVVYQRCLPSIQSQSGIPRVHQKSLKDVPVNDDLKRYTKPAKRPEPLTVKDSSFLRTEDRQKSDAIKRDHLWLISRQRHNTDIQQECPSWAGFNSIVSNTDLPLATVRYLPFLNAPPSDLNTIYTMLFKLTKLANELGQEHILVTADMAIYSKAQQIIWTHLPELEGKVTMRIGGMHMTMAFLASLGKLYGSGGLLSLLVDSNVYSEATANQMIQGKQYSRGVRGIKLVHEALYRLLFHAMHSWLATKSQDVSTLMDDQKICNLQDAFSSNDVEEARKLVKDLEEEDEPALLATVAEFREVGRSQSETFAYWDNFLAGGDVLLHMLRAEREGNFELHLQATSEAVPWFYAAGRNQYRKFVPIYVAEMKDLENSKPESYKHLLDGGFVVRRTDNCKFNAVATDQALEQTVNRDGKSKGGVIGLTKRKTALTRWLTTRHITAEYVEAFTARGKSHSDKPHQELGKARRERDEADVLKIIDNVANIQNPFDLNTVPSELTNIITGQVASKEVRESLTHILEHGSTKNKEFLKSRVLSSKTKSFWDAESRMKVKTFDDMKKPVTCKTKEKLIVDSEVLFRRLLVVSKEREVNLKDVLTHELSAISPSLFHDDGSMRKTTKSDLAKKLETSVDCITGELTEVMTTGYILDGMSLLQGMKDTLFVTFLDLADIVLRFVMNPFAKNQGVETVVIVFDRYDHKQSVKAGERHRRGEIHQAGYVIQGNRQVPNYRQFLKISGNKAALAAFVSDYIANAVPSMLSGYQKIILAGGYLDGRITKLVTSAGATSIPELFSSHEEADTRMLLHAIELSLTHQRLVVRCDDTDVLVLQVYYCNKKVLSEFVYMLSGHSGAVVNKQRYVPVHLIVAKHCAAFCESLPAAHALTGCDSTSSLYQVGKRIAYTKLLELVSNGNFSLSAFAIQNEVEDDISSARTYILSLYGKKAKTCLSLDQLRYLLASTTDKPASQLPPTEDAFKQHVLRARYQTSIWCQSHIANPSLASPNGNGWHISDGQLEPVFYTKESAPVEVRDLTHMYCADRDCKQSNKCHCCLNNLRCTEFCTCRGNCQNKEVIVFDSDDDDDNLD